MSYTLFQCRDIFRFIPPVYWWLVQRSEGTVSGVDVLVMPFGFFTCSAAISHRVRLKPHHSIRQAPCRSLYP